MENVEILGKTMWIIWGNYCGLGWKIVYNWEIGFHKLTRCGKYGEFMCIKLSTVKIPQIKGFFEDESDIMWAVVNGGYINMEFLEYQD